MEEIHLGNKVETIGWRAFYNCTSLKSVNWINSIRSLGSDAFAGCTSLSSVELSSNLDEMGSSVFYGCTNITKLVVNDGCSVIGGTAFVDCSKLKTVEIPGSVTFIGNSAFGKCTALTTVSIGDGLKKINDEVFNGCTDLQEISIGAKTSDVGWRAFYGCTSLRKISVYNTEVPSTNNDVFAHFDATLSVPASSVNDYKAHETWGKFGVQALAEPVYLTIIQAAGGYLKQAVAMSEQLSFTVIPEEGWEINTVVFNGEDVTGQLVNSVYTTPALSADGILQVSYQVKTDVSAVRANDIKAYGDGDDIVVRGTGVGDIINVYSADGVLQSSRVADGGELRINANSGAVYIVKSGEKTIKVAL